MVQKIKNLWMTKPKMLISIVIIIVVIPTLFMGGVKVAFQEDSLILKGTMYPDSEFLYQDIEQVEFVEHMEAGQRNVGVGTIKLNLGTYHNNTLGNYLLYGYTACDSYVVIHTKERIVAVNGKDREQTQNIYEELMKHL